MILGNQLLVTAVILVYSLADAKGFDVIWRYFAWANQLLATFTLWAITFYLKQNKKGVWYLITLLPALFMTMVSVSYIFIAPEGFRFAAHGLSWLAYLIAAIVTITLLIIFALWARKYDTTR